MSCNVYNQWWPIAAQLALDLYNDESLTLNDENRDAR
jgi:hypothetical protein